MWTSTAVPSTAPSPSPQQQSNSAKSTYPSSFAYPPTPPVEMKMEANSHIGNNSSGGGGDYLNSGGGGGLPGMNDLHRHHSPDVMAFSASAYSAMPSSSSPSSLAGKKFHEGTQMSVEHSLDQQQQQQQQPQSHNNPQQPAPTTVAAVSASTAYPYFAAPSADLSSPLYSSFASSGVMKGPFCSSSPSSIAAGIKQSSRSKTSRSNAGKISVRCQMKMLACLR